MLTLTLLEVEMRMIQLILKISCQQQVFIIAHSGIPVFWRSKLQTETALSTFEAEHVALSTAMREVVPIIELLK